MNLVEATHRGRARRVRRLPRPAAAGSRRAPGSELRAGTVILGIRPQDFEDAAFADPSRPTIDVEVAVVEELGSATHLLFAIDAPPVDTAAVRAATDDRERAVAARQRQARALHRRGRRVVESPRGPDAHGSRWTPSGSTSSTRRRARRSPPRRSPRQPGSGRRTRRRRRLVSWPERLKGAPA